MKTLTATRYIQESPEGMYFKTSQGVDLYPVSQASISEFDPKDLFDLDLQGKFLKGYKECSEAVGGVPAWVRYA